MSKKDKPNPNIAEALTFLRRVRSNALAHGRHGNLFRISELGGAIAALEAECPTCPPPGDPGPADPPPGDPPPDPPEGN